MTACIFLGPTIRPDDVERILPGAVCLPPVQQGDIFRAVNRYHPQSIGIIDGFFGGAPSVWHKEILWALSQGIHVFGSASMGALRAAELSAFGMTGVGRIFEWFRDGRLEDDDEVAVIHGPAELDFLAASDPMVNIRATLNHAALEGVLSEATRQALEGIAKACFFQDRAWDRLLADARQSPVEQTQLDAFEAWLPHGMIDQKRLDALEMLAAMQDCQTKGQVFVPSFVFEHTWFWEDMIARSPDVSRLGDEASQWLDRLILDELRLEGLAAYEPVRARAAARLLARRNRQAVVTPDEIRRRLSNLREARGLYSRVQLQAWIKSNGLDGPALSALMEDGVRVEAALRQNPAELDRCILDELRLSATYPDFAERARRKREALADGVARAAAPEPDEMTLRHWYFGQRLQIAYPEDIGAFAAGLGYVSLAAWTEALRREFLYANLHTQAGGSDAPRRCP